MTWSIVLQFYSVAALVLAIGIIPFILTHPRYKNITFVLFCALTALLSFMGGMTLSLGTSILESGHIEPVITSFKLAGLQLLAAFGTLTLGTLYFTD